MNAVAKPFAVSFAILEVTTPVITTVIGPVGSEIKVGVPPNNAANKPVITVLYKPDIGPNKNWCKKIPDA